MAAFGERRPPERRTPPIATGCLHSRFAPGSLLNCPAVGGVRLGIGEAVHLPGPRPVDELEGLLGEADVLVSPRTRGANTPMKVYSYLDAGRPVLATRLPTHTQVLDDGIALLAEPEPEAFGAAMTRLAGDAALRQALGEAGRKRVRERHSPEAVRREVVEIYREVSADVAALEPNGGTAPHAAKPG